MRLDFTNRSKAASYIKRINGLISHSSIPSLSTPVGDYFGDDILEGFAADAEHLGRSNE